MIVLSEGGVRSIPLYHRELGAGKGKCYPSLGNVHVKVVLRNGSGRGSNYTLDASPCRIL